MRRFAELYAAIDASNKTSDKVAAMRAYFASAPPEDAAWAVYFLTGRRPRQVVSTKNLVAWAMAAAQVPEWLFNECYEVVGDLAETVALLLPEATIINGEGWPLHRWVEDKLLKLVGRGEEEQRAVMTAAWAELGTVERLVWNKLITGAFRVGVAQSLVVRALSEVSGLATAVVAHRLMGAWEPGAAWMRGVLAADAGDADASRPYPFLLAHPLEEGPEGLGEIGGWQVEWKWDGIRSQIIKRGGEVYVWSRGEELISERFPEVVEAARGLADGTVIDGEILPWKDGAVLPFAELQKRIGRKTLTKKILADVPVVVLTFDCLEMAGKDLRERPLRERRGLLEQVVSGEGTIRLSPIVRAGSWEALARLREGSRAQQVEGVMIKRLASPYGVGRPRGDWWKWKIEPHTVDAVLIYAQRGQGRRASLYTDYTFGVWRGDELVPFCKAYSGLTDAEIVAVDRFVRENTIEKFGPVRTVRPALVFEIGFEGIARSTRHKPGVAVRFPRMLRWRTDKGPADADRVEQLQALLPAA
jgi:DNA ligase-1